MEEKLNYLRQKLLDTGKRNRLLNFRETKRSTLKITYPSTIDLFSSILSSKTLEFPNDLESTDENQRIDEMEVYKKKKFVLAPKSLPELNKTLYQLKMKSKTAFEELGINILYLAFGFLEWKESEFSNDVYKAPIVLVPIEISRESINSPYKITIFDDDTVINPTLLYKLENDYGIKITNDLDFEEIELSRLLVDIENQINMKNWRVVDEAQISLFSFLKLNMFKDLEINESLVLENDVIKAIFGDTSGLNPIPEEINDEYNLENIQSSKDTFQVVDADASQQQAILAAKNGVSFVLQGPPGTGKSQTITNIISELLSQGKKVLFVSEKMAALEVVHRNLQNVRLEDFCLELHSHKANKLQVIKQLADTLKQPKTNANGNYIEELETLDEDKTMFKQYIIALHKKREPLNKSVFQIHGEIAKLHNIQNVQYKINNISQINSKSIFILREALDSYSISIKNLSTNYKKHPFYGFVKSEITFEYQNEIEEHLRVFKNTLLEIIDILNEARQYFDLNMFETINDLPRFVDFLSLVVAAPDIPSAYLNLHDISEIISFIHELEKLFNEIIFLESKTHEIFTDEIFSIGDDELLNRFESDYSSLFRIFNQKYKYDLQNIRKTQNIPNKRISYKIILQQLEVNSQLRGYYQKINWIESIIQHQLPKFYQGRNTDWKSLYLVLEWVKDVTSKFDISEFSSQCAEMICKNQSKIPANLFKEQLFSVHEQLKICLKFNYEIFNSNEYDIKSEPIEESIKKLSLQLENLEKLSVWIDYSRARNVCINLELNEFLLEIEEKAINPNEFVDTLIKRIYLLWIDNIYKQENSLLQFRKDIFEKRICNFKQRDLNQFSIAQARIRQLLSSQRPDIHGFASKGTEIHTLLRESEKRRKILPIRKLFERIPNLLPALKPCLLMSPLSVSLFLDPMLYQFDTVIFDEASQVCTENALGAIYRSKQLIMVGDREQLPPTNFFVANTTDNEFEDDEESDFGAYESILDECSGVLHSLSLLWHYRSRHEQLITYSNAKIYKNLITFPTPIPNGEDIGVEFVFVPDGIYLRSSLRTNVTEAKKVAEMVFQHFSTHPDRSLGVVTFSEKQKDAIDDEINTLRKQRQEFEYCFNDNNIEPFFIKNLENVQGDERDTIIFSIGYGKDQNGKMSMYFGPLNRDGGYRRLNVAITRAKYNIKLVSSIKPQDIDLNRTESKGVKLLRGYMEFAIHGPDAIKEDLILPETLEFDSPFEMDVYDVLVQNGFDVTTQVGCSGYRIDLAVKHPKLIDRYVLAIECDGATYHSGKTARERDRLREQVLRDRGWSFYRIWSTNWIRQRKTAIENLIEAVHNSIDSYLVSADDYSEFATSNPSEFIEPIDEETLIDEPGTNIFDHYLSYDKEAVGSHRYGVSQNYLIDLITFIVNSESPIHIERVYQYIAPYLDRKKVTSIVTSTVDNILYYESKGKFNIKGDFLWSLSMEKPRFRIPTENSGSREIKHIAKEELAEGMLIIIKNSIGIERYTLFQELGKVLGINRIGENIIYYLEVAFRYLEDENLVVIKNNIVSLK